MRAFLGAAAMVLLAGCGLVKFPVYASSSATIQGSQLPSLITLPFGGSFTSFDISQTQEMKNQGVGKNDIKSAKLTAFTLTVRSGESFNQFLNSVRFYVETDGQPKLLVAEKNGIDTMPAGTNRLDLDLKDVELKPYVTAPSMKITADVTGQPPSNTTVIDAAVTIMVTVF